MTPKQRILIVEDEKRILNFMKTVLTANEYDVVTTSSGREACTMISSHCPDLIVLDMGLPDMDGMDIIRSVRAWTQMPIVVVSARTHEWEKVDALDAGADDYVTKPFGTHELLARIRTALRHTRSRNMQETAAAGSVFMAGGLTIDYDKRQVQKDGEPLHLTQNEFRLLSLLSANAGKVLTYDFILKELWGPGSRGDNQSLRVHMANLRRKLEENPAEPHYIFTEVGVGYRMVEGD